MNSLFPYNGALLTVSSNSHYTCKHYINPYHLVIFFLCRYLEEPTMIASFCGKQAGKHVVHIACGSTYSAAITADGELYTWGRGNYGRLGHGNIILTDYVFCPRKFSNYIFCLFLPLVTGHSYDFKALVRTRPPQCW